MREKLSDPLYRNSFFLILTNGLTAVSGFIFWVLAARLYPAKDVGLASAAIALGQLVSTLSIMGFDMGTIKFVHELDAEEIISTSASFVTVISLMMATFTVLLAKHLSKKTAEFLIFPVNILFAIFIIVRTLNVIFRQGIFVAIRDTKKSLIQSLSFLPRLFLLPLVISLQTLGIFISFALTPFFGLSVGILLAHKAGYRLKPELKIDLLKKIFLYSFSNYISVILENLPAFILPIMVVNMLGAKENAYFYIAWAISILLIAIPRSTSMSLFAECSYSELEIKKKVYKSMKFITFFVVPGIIAIYLGGRYLLHFFGKEYAFNSLELLRILVFAALPYSICTVYAAVCRAKKRMGEVIAIFFVISAVTLVLSYFLIKKIGITGIGYSWLIGNSAGVLLILFLRLKS